MLTDYHVHLREDGPDSAAGDAFTPENVDRYRRCARENGISELGVSEHIHRFRDALSIWQHPFWQVNARDDIEEYCGFIRTETDLRLGIEADFIAGKEDRIETFLDRFDWDYVIGSVHFLSDCSVDMNDQTSIWRRGWSAERVWRSYFEHLAESARSGLYDIIAHPDLVKIWGSGAPVPDGDLRRFYEPAVEAFVESNVAVEVSTAGLRKPVNEIYPATAFLEMIAEAGVPIALSSDAHRSEHLGFAYDRALELLASVGITELATFEHRDRTLRPLG